MFEVGDHVYFKCSVREDYKGTGIIRDKETFPNVLYPYWVAFDKQINYSVGRMFNEQELELIEDPSSLEDFL
jgi:hypothetical protein